ncbi:MAG: DUF4271 domain-containing protein [Cryomorphaceae bacterium]|nr:DUF4271 domain-containing protein [Cryomorphaceae bacterium]
MLESGLPTPLHGSAHAAPSDALFWVAAIITLALGLLLQRAPLNSNRWTFVLQFFIKWEDPSARLWVPNLLLVTFLSILAFLILGTESIPHLIPGYNGPWYGLYLLPTLAIMSQLMVHLLFGRIWESHKLHWRHWSERFSFLPALWVALPSLLWFLVAFEARKSILEPFFIVIVLLGVGFYALGLIRALFRYISRGLTPWYLAFLYLCALEASPLFWILFFQTYES